MMKLMHNSWTHPDNYYHFRYQRACNRWLLVVLYLLCGPVIQTLNPELSLLSAYGYHLVGTMIMFFGVILLIGISWVLIDTFTTLNKWLRGY